MDQFETPCWARDSTGRFAGIRPCASGLQRAACAGAQRAGGLVRRFEWQSGAAGCLGDIGTHAENLAEYITGLHIQELAADLTTFVEGRALDDDGNVLLRFDNGAKGILHSSQISVGEENDLNIRVYGELGGLEWHQQEPNTLLVKWNDRPTEIRRTGLGYLGAANLAEHRKRARFIRVTPAGQREAAPHDVIEIKAGS